MVMSPEDEDWDIGVHTTDSVEDGGPFAIGPVDGHVTCDDATNEKARKSNSER